MDGGAKRMDNPAKMTLERPISPHQPANPITSGEFQQGRGYTNWRPRGSGDWLLIFTVAGRGRVVADGSAAPLEPGHAVLFAPGAEQDYSTDEQTGFWHLRWSHFQPRPHWKAWLAWPPLARGVGRLELQGEPAAAVAGALQRLLVFRRLGERGDRELAMNALEEALIWCSRVAAREPLAQMDPRVQAAARHLAGQLNSPFQVAAVAKACGLSASRLSHLFKAQVGETLQRYSERLRLESARHLLQETELSVSQVAAELGYSDPLYFSRRYRRLWGCAPLHERRRRPAG